MRKNLCDEPTTNREPILYPFARIQVGGQIHLAGFIHRRGNSGLCPLPPSATI
jgi:hypothetical protein